MNKKIYMLFVLLTLCTTAVSAQTMRSIYFSERNPMRHQLNPAFAPENGYVSFPFLSNISLGVTSNLKVSSLLYPKGDGTLMTFLHPDVDSKEAMKGFKNSNNLGGNVGLDLISFGFYKWGGFNNFTLGIKANSTTNLPKDFFGFLKEGMSQPTGNNYDLSSLGTTNSAYAEIALGHSREMIIPGLRLGAKLKFLLGVANVDAEFDKFDISLNDDKWIMNTNGTLSSSMLVPSYNDEGLLETFEEIEPGINGFGMALDLGATYTFFDELNVSAAINDIGFISWKSYKAQTAQGDGNDIEYSGFEDIDIFGDENNFEDELDQTMDDMEALFSFYDAKTGKNSNATNTTFNIGADYGVLNRKIIFGLLSTTQITKQYTWTDLMASVNFVPAKWFNFGLNASVSNLGTTYGALLDMTGRGFSFFVGVNTMSLKYANPGIPINGVTTNLNFGFNFMMGRNTADKQ